MKGYDKKRSDRKTTQMLAYQKKRERIDIRNSRTFGYGYAILTGFAVFVVLIIAFALFFKVEKVNIFGNEHYSDAEIIEATDFKAGDNLYLFNKYGKLKRALNMLPYLDEIRIRRKLPSTVTIEVTETEAYFALEAADCIWLADIKGKLLEYLPLGSDTGDYKKVIGLDLHKADVGVKLSSLDDAQADIFLALVSELEAQELLENVDNIDVSVSYDIVFIYDERLTVSTGIPEALAKKAAYLSEIVSRLEKFAEGTIDLGGNPIRFIPTEALPESETETETESETETETDTETETESETETETEVEPVG